MLNLLTCLLQTAGDVVLPTLSPSISLSPSHTHPPYCTEQCLPKPNAKCSSEAPQSLEKDHFSDKEKQDVTTSLFQDKRGQNEDYHYGCSLFPKWPLSVGDLPLSSLLSRSQGPPGALPQHTRSTLPPAFAHHRTRLLCESLALTAFGPVCNQEG